MILIYASTQRRSEELVKALHHHDAVSVPTLADVGTNSSEARAIILELPHIEDPAQRAYVRWLRKRTPALPMVPVTDSTRQNARWLVDLPVNIVVWIDEVSETLSDAVVTVLSAGTVSRAVQILRSSSQFRGLGESLFVALQRDPPPKTVEELAKLAFTSVSTLERHVRQVVDRPDRSAHALLSWIHLFGLSTNLQPESNRWPSLRFSESTRQLLVDPPNGLPG